MFDLWRAIDEVRLKPQMWVQRMSYSQWPGEGGVTLEVDGRNVRYGGCRRRSFYRYLHYKPDTIGEDFPAAWKKQVGNWTQDMFRHDLTIAGLWIGSEVPISIIREMGEFGRYRLSGRIDEIFRNPDTGNAEAIEFKTKGFFGESGLMKATKDKPLAPDQGEVLQVVPYLDWLGMPAQGIPDPAINMMYFSREGNRSQFRISLTTEGFPKIETPDNRELIWTHLGRTALYEDFDFKARAFATGEVPPRDYELKWSRETVIWKHEHGELKKTDDKKVATALEKGQAGAILDAGDWRCEWCSYKMGCHEQRPDFRPIEDNMVQIQRTGEVGFGQKLTQQEVHVPPTPGS